MGFGLSDRGEELLLGLALGVRDAPAELVFGLYDDRADTLGDADGFDAANSEPTGVGSYARTSATWPDDVSLSYDGTADEWGLTVTIDLSFDVIGVESEVTGWLVGGTYQADADSSPTQHLLGRGPLEDPNWPDGSGLPAGAYPLAATDQFVLEATTARITLD